MKNGHLIKEKTEYIKEWFTTSEGLFDFFIGSFIWGFITINFNEQVFNFLKDRLLFMGVSSIINYFAYLGFAIFSVFLGIGITYILMILHNLIIKK